MRVAGRGGEPYHLPCLSDSAGSPSSLVPAPTAAQSLWSVLCDPDSLEPLRREGDELVSPGGKRWPIVRGIPRFVPSDQYVGSFSFEWNTHKTTQLDMHTGATASEESLREKTGLSPDQVRGKLILDAGVGAGRYADVLSRWGARVVGVDLSYAVEAAYQNVGDRPQVLVSQADIFKLPFAPATFDLIVSIGVLHHTPDTKAAFLRLVPLLKPGGEICIWVYPPTHHFLLRQHWVPFVRHLRPEWFHTWCRWFVPLVKRHPRSPLVRYAQQFFECSNQHLGLENDILDTFDGYSPYYHGVHGTEEVLGWFREAGLTEVHSFPAVTAVRGRRPASG